MNGSGPYEVESIDTPDPTPDDYRNARDELDDDPDRPATDAEVDALAAMLACERCRRERQVSLDYPYE